MLVDPELLKLLFLGVLRLVPLMSEELELNARKESVPKDWKVIDLIVLDNSPETIEQIVASNPECKGYKIVDQKQVIEENSF